MDFLLKDIAFLEPADRERKLSDGLKFGNLGRDGVDRIVSMAIQLSGTKSAKSVFQSLEKIPTNILRDFFSKNDNAKNLFSLAREFESLGYKTSFPFPNALEPSLKSVISVMLDYFGIERKRFFETLKSD